MSLLHESEIEIDEPHRFRAPTIDAALADARAALGDDVRIVEANRIRRGGVGGFFATDLGVELIVAIGPESADGDSANLGGDEITVGVVDAAPEYLDAVLPARHLPRASATTSPTSPTAPVAASAASSGKPHFYDRVVEESAPEPVPAAATSPGIQRLLDTATSAERRPATVSRATFADHLARHLDDGGGANPTVVVARGSSAPSVDVADVRVPNPTVDADMPIDQRAEAVTASTAVGEPSVAHSGASADAATEIARATAATPSSDAAMSDSAGAAPGSTGDPSALANDATPDAPAEAASAEVDTGPARGTPNASRRSASSSKTARDPLRRPIDLAAGAVGRLVEQLSDVSPVEGSRMRDLSRLVVRVTTPDGATIEIAAELHGDGHV